LIFGVPNPGIRPSPNDPWSVSSKPLLSLQVGSIKSIAAHAASEPCRIKPLHSPTRLSKFWPCVSQFAEGHFDEQRQTPFSTNRRASKQPLTEQLRPYLSRVASLSSPVGQVERPLPAVGLQSGGNRRHRPRCGLSDPPGQKARAPVPVESFLASREHVEPCRLASP